MTEVVLDSSAIIANINGEPGGDVVASLLDGSLVSSISFAEVLTKLMTAGMPEGDAVLAASQSGCRFVDTDQEQATSAGVIHASSRDVGISMADAFCLALAKVRGCPVMTADRAWMRLKLGVEVRLIR